MKSLICIFSLVLGVFILSVSAQNVVVLQNDFEKGTEGWEPRGIGNVSISSSKKEAANGEKSLKVSGRKANWQGTQLNVTKTLTAGKSYKFTVSVKLDKGEKPDEIKMTMQRGDNTFDGVGLTNATPDAWSTFSGNFKPMGNDSYLLLYIEAARERTSFYVDDFKIETVPDAPEQEGVLLKTDFEDKTAQNWFVRGEGVQMFSSTAGGSRSLKVSNRTLKWHGLALDTSPLFFKGRTYQISASVKLVAGQTADMLKISMQETPPNGDPKYVEIAPATKVTDGEWVTLTGKYLSTTDNNNLLICVEAEGEKTSFYLDNFELMIP